MLQRSSSLPLSIYLYHLANVDIFNDLLLNKYI